MARDHLHGTSLLPIIGQNIRAYRKARGWSQAELAYRCGMSRGQMNDLERRVQHASVWTLKRIADAFGCILLVDDLITTSEAVRETLVKQLKKAREREGTRAIPKGDPKSQIFISEGSPLRAP